MTVISRQLRKAFDQDIESLGVTRSQWMVIAVVKRQPGATQRVIAEALEMSEAAAGRLVDRLCAEGLLERRAREGDKRAYCVFLTDAATPIVEKVGVVAARLEEENFRGIDVGELAQLSALLDRLYGNLNGCPAGTPKKMA